MNSDEQTLERIPTFSIIIKTYHDSFMDGPLEK